MMEQNNSTLKIFERKFLVSYSVTYERKRI